jgi:hypothetical protein
MFSRRFLAGLATAAALALLLLVAVTISLWRRDQGQSRATTRHEEGQTFFSMTPAQHLDLAKKAQAGKDYQASLAHLRAIPAGAAEATEGARLAKVIEPLREPQLREALRAQYQQFAAATFSNLNGIQTKLTPAKGGYALWATHEYFNRYTFSIGPAAPVVSAWIAAHREELLAARIVRVGVMGRDSYDGYCYFDVK